MTLPLFALLAKFVRSSKLGHILAVLTTATVFTLITRLTCTTTLATSLAVAAAAAALALVGYMHTQIHISTFSNKNIEEIKYKTAPITQAYYNNLNEFLHITQVMDSLHLLNLKVWR